MGQICTTHNTQHDEIFKWTLKSDPREKDVDHHGSIHCDNLQKEKILKTYEQELRKQKSLFKDPSMSTDPILLKSRASQIKCTYERPYKFLPTVRKGEKYKILNYKSNRPDSIHVHDEVMQYLGVFLCFLADKPHLIQKIITTSENPFGIHVIDSFKDGHSRSFLIDDYILCKEGKPLFSQPIEDDLMWPCLIEKAWFKLEGNTSRKFQESSPEHLFETFTQIPFEKFHIGEKLSRYSERKMEELYQNFQQKGRKEKNYILTSKKNPKHDLGLAGKKHFYLLDSFIFESKRIFYIRNPCDQFSFRGIYSEITKQIQEALSDRGIHQVEPGNFIVDQEEIFEQFSEILMAYYIPDNSSQTLNIALQDNEEHFISFDIKEKGNLSLRVNQMLPSYVQEKQYLPLTYHVVRVNDNHLIGGRDNLQGCFGVKHTSLLENDFEDLNPGEYLIRLKFKGVNSNAFEVKTSLSSYFPGTISFDQQNQKQKIQKWSNYLQTQAQRSLARSKVKTKNKDIIDTICWLGDIAVVYAENLKKKQISLEVGFPDLLNLACLTHSQLNKNESWATFPLEHSIMIVFERIDLTAETKINQYHLEPY